MEFIRQIERLQLMNKLLREQRTGSPEQLAERLGVSRRQMYVYLEYLKDLGVDVQFSRRLNSFKYAGNKQIRIDWKFEVLDDSELKDVFGGTVDYGRPFYKIITSRYNFANLPILEF